MFRIGHWEINQPTILAPMAGITDKPFRRICTQFGVGLTVSEMVASNTALWNSRKSQQRLAYDSSNSEPRSVQIVGNDPQLMAEAAQENAVMGAQIIDINMGCPAKKVCRKAAGSALLRDEPLVKSILTAVVSAVEIPVTLKIRTGWCPSTRNGTTIARIAEDCGIKALAVHGHTRACAFKGSAEYDTIADIVDKVSIPVFANGDITSPQCALSVLKHTNANAVMIGRGAQGNLWLFREINHYLETGKLLSAPTIAEIRSTLNDHVKFLHTFYGDITGMRIARKHVAWYLSYQAVLQCRQRNEAPEHPRKCSRYTSETNSGYSGYVNQRYQSFRKAFNRIESTQEQCDSLELYFEQLATTEDKTT